MKKVLFVIFALALFAAISLSFVVENAPEKTFEENNVIKVLCDRLYFTEKSAEYLAEIFANVGITSISDIKRGPGTGIEELQSYTCKIYNKNMKLTFTFENSYLIYIGLSGTTLYDEGRYKAKYNYESNKITKY